MVLGVFKRKKSNPPADTGARPMGEKTEKGYIPHPQELAKAEPLPDWLLGVEETLSIVPEEEYGWVLLNTRQWKPKGPKGQVGRLLAEPVRLPGKKYTLEALIWNPDGRMFLVDALTYTIIGLSDGSRTAGEIAEIVLTKFIEALPSDNPLRKAFESEEKNNSDVEGTIAAVYAQMALLRHKGIIA